MGFLEGRSALITGGASGIGLATTRLFLDQGAHVAVVDLQPPPGGEGDLFVEADVADPGAWPGIVERVVQKLGGIDVGFLNAGVTSREADIESLSDEEYRRVMRVDVDHVVFGTRELVRHMRPRGGGNIVATASLAGLTGLPMDPIYSLAKHAVVGLVRSLGPALEPAGIRINAVCPGITETPMTESVAGGLKDVGFPLLQPEEIATAVVMALEGGGAGLCYACQPGRDPLVYKFAGVPGPRTAGKEGMAPPLPTPGSSPP